MVRARDNASLYHCRLQHSNAETLHEKFAPLGYTHEQTECAACEAVSQALEKGMASGKHLGKMGHKRRGERTDLAGGDGAVERMEVLYGVCDTMYNFMPAELEKVA